MNQYTVISGTSISYDARGNLTSDGSRTFGYDLENHLVSASTGSTTLAYDPLGRLHTYNTSSVATDFLYDGDNLSAEYNASGTMLRRYVHGPGVDEPVVWYEGSGTSDRRYLITDNQGTVIAEDGASIVRYAYGPYGEPASWSGSRFRYTGQIALPELALYHYKARVYDPVLGRFLQTDPIRYRDDMNLYEYVRDDALNGADPTGKHRPDEDIRAAENGCHCAVDRASGAPVPPHAVPTTSPSSGTTISGVTVGANVAPMWGGSITVGSASKGGQSVQFVSVGGALGTDRASLGESVVVGAVSGQTNGNPQDVLGDSVSTGAVAGNVVGVGRETTISRSADNSRMVTGSQTVVGFVQGASGSVQANHTYSTQQVGAAAENALERGSAALMNAMARANGLDDDDENR